MLKTWDTWPGVLIQTCNSIYSDDQDERIVSLRTAWATAKFKDNWASPGLYKVQGSIPSTTANNVCICMTVSFLLNATSSPLSQIRVLSPRGLHPAAGLNSELNTLPEPGKPGNHQSPDLLGEKNLGGWLPVLGQETAANQTGYRAYTEFPGQRLVEFHVHRMGFLFYRMGAGSGS